MQYGRSLVRNCLIHAVDITRGQCIEWQIVCPACAKAVHKCQSAITDLHYLRHYADPRANCEQRVRHIVTTELRRPLIYTVPSDANLAAFMLKFESIVLEGFDRDDLVARMWHQMRARPAFRAAIREFATNVQRQPFIMPQIMAEVWSRKPPPEFEMTPALNVARFLTATNSQRATMFAISFAAILMQASVNDDDLLRTMDTKIDWTWIAILTEGSNSEFKRWWQIHQRNDMIYTGMLHLLASTAINFVIAVINQSIDMTAQRDQTD